MFFGKGDSDMNKKVSVYDRCLAIGRLDIVRDWYCEKNNGLSVYEVSSVSKKVYWWKCDKCGNEWEKSVYSRCQSLSSCPVCMKKELNLRKIKKIQEQRETLQDKYPDVAKEWDYEANFPYKPNEVSFGSSKKFAWVCSKCGYKWETTVGSRTLAGTGCNKCGQLSANQKRYETLLANSGSLSEKYPEIAKEWFFERNGDLHPDIITPYSNEKVWWKCVRGHKYQAIVNSRTRRNCGCPTCSKESKTSFPEQVIY